MSLSNVSGWLSRVGVVAATVGVGVTALQATLYNVDGGERAVIFSRFSGVLEEVVGEGTHLIVPWLYTPHILDIRTRPRTISSVTGTKDLQMVQLGLRVLSKPQEQQLPTIFKRLGPDWDERILPSIGSEVVKSIVAQYPAEELLTKREDVSKEVRKSLTERAAQFGILLDDVAITHLSFSPEFTKAVEQKQVALQEAERAKFVVMKSDQERKAAVIKAEGEAEAARLISESTRKAGSGLLELRRIEASKEVASTMARSRNVIYLPNQGNMLLNLPSVG